MPYIKIEHINEGVSEIVAIHNVKTKPVEDNPEEFIFVDYIQDPENLFGKEPVFLYKHSDNTVFIEYRDRPLTQDEELQQIRVDYGTFLLESANDKAKIANLEATTGDLIMEVAALKMGGNM